MDKAILQDYIDACELAKETEIEIRKLNRKKRTVVQTSVRGSSPDFPYTEQRFRVQGTAFTVADDSHLRHEGKILAQRMARAEEVKRQVDEWLLTVPLRMQRIIRYKFFEGNTWEQVAKRLGRRASGESVRKEFENFIKN